MQGLKKVFIFIFILCNVFLVWDAQLVSRPEK